MTGFRECYLIPKQTYDAVVRDQPAHKEHLPDDIQMKLNDFRQRYNFDENKKDKGKIRSTHEEHTEILESVRDSGKREIAKKILDFIQTRTGGTINWDPHFNVILDGQILFGVDIRDVVRVLVGDIRDFDHRARPVFQKLEELRIHPSLLLFYDRGEKPWVPVLPQDVGWSSLRGSSPLSSKPSLLDQSSSGASSGEVSPSPMIPDTQRVTRSSTPSSRSIRGDPLGLFPTPMGGVEAPASPSLWERWFSTGRIVGDRGRAAQAHETRETPVRPPPTSSSTRRKGQRTKRSEKRDTSPLGRSHLMRTRSQQKWLNFHS
jgi:hypothetical protein